MITASCHCGLVSLEIEAGLYADALAGLPEKMDDQLPLPVPQVCPMTLDQMPGEE